MSARFAPTELTADLSKLSPNDRKVLAKLVRVSKLIDAIFLRQVWGGNVAMLLDLSADPSPAGRARLHYFLLNRGPWSRLDGDQPFVPGAPAKPENAGFYPDDAKKEEVEKWIASLPPEEAKQARSFFTVVRRDADGRDFRLVPYNMEYQSPLLEAAQLLREAAALASEPSLQKFLEARAEAFLTNDYYASDVAWMELDSKIEPTIGPYEVYEDGWFNYKAAFESFIGDSRRKRKREAAEILRRAAGDREPFADRSEVSQPAARRARAHRGDQRNLLRRRCESRRADRRLQSAE